MEEFRRTEEAVDLLRSRSRPWLLRFKPPCLPLNRTDSIGVLPVLIKGISFEFKNDGLPVAFSTKELQGRLVEVWRYAVRAVSEIPLDKRPATRFKLSFSVQSVCTLLSPGQYPRYTSARGWPKTSQATASR